MEKLLTLCLVLLTATSLTITAYADMIAPDPGKDAGDLAAILLVGLVIAVTAWLLQGFGKKR